MTNEEAMEAIKKQSKWIPVSERLPEEIGGYLVSIGDWVGLVPFIDGKFWNDCLGESLFEFPVEAWMPLPKPYSLTTEEDK